MYVTSMAPNPIHGLVERAPEGLVGVVQVHRVARGPVGLRRRTPGLDPRHLARQGREPGMAAPVQGHALVEVTDAADEDRSVALAEHVDAGLLGCPDEPELVPVLEADGDRTLEDFGADSVSDSGELARVQPGPGRPAAAGRRRTAGPGTRGPGSVRLPVSRGDTGTRRSASCPCYTWSLTWLSAARTSSRRRPLRPADPRTP